MRKPKIYLLSAVGFVILAGIGVVLNAGRAMAQGPHGGGAPVTVTNTVSTPVWVRNVNDAIQPVEFIGGCGFTEIFCSVDVVTVPTGKRLVIEFASMTAHVPAGQAITMFVKTGLFAGHALPLSPPAPANSFIFSSTSMAQQVRLYAEPGTIVQLQAERTDFGLLSGVVRFTISGYLVDVPLSS